MLMRAGITLLWLARLLPFFVLAILGRGAGMLMFWLGAKPRRVARTNLKLCFPGLSEKDRERLLRRHFQALGRSLLDYGILWWSSKERIERLVKVCGIEHWQAVRDRPVIWLAPHFVGL